MRKFLILILLLVFVPDINAKSYYLPNADLRYEILPDGTVLAEEKISFQFSGAYTFAYRVFPRGEWQIGDFRAYDVTIGKKELQVARSGSSDGDKHTWYYNAINERKTFLLTYSIHGGFKAYDDAGEFYWKVWGDGWAASLQNLYGEITLPSAVNDPKEVYTWGHPELKGKIAMLDNRRVIFQTFNIPANRWVEVRTVFPRDLLSGTSGAIRVQGAGLQKIIDEEKRWKDSQLFDSAIIDALLPAIFFVFAVLIIIGIGVMRLASKTNPIRKIFSLIFTLLIGAYFTFMIADTVGGSVKWNYLELLGFIILEGAVFAGAWQFFGKEPDVPNESI